MCHHTPYPAIEGKHCEKSWLVGLEAERADGENPLDYRSEPILLHA